MEEKHVTVGKRTYGLELPFFVLATQNPLEMEGTYPLPEAQLDRFFMKLKVEYPDAGSLNTILNRTTRSREPEVSRVLNGAQILDMRKTVRSVPIARPIQEYAIRIMMATHPETTYAHPLAKRYVRCGASPRGAQALVVGAKMRALLNDRIHVSTADIRSVVLGSLRHRVLLNFEGEADRMSTDTILAEILKATPEPN
jgi:MoxR-like ATPase